MDKLTQGQDIAPDETSIELPEVVVTPETPNEPANSGKGPPPVTPNVQDHIAEARASGESWDAINDRLGQEQQGALDQGHSPSAIAAHMGYQSGDALKDRLTAGAARNAADETPIELKAGDALPTAVRQAYADAMITGETTGPDHFADAYHGAGHPPVEGMAAQLPDHQDVTDHSIGILADSDLPLTADFIKQTKANVLDAWAQTGLTPSQLYSAAVNDPSVSRLLTSLAPPLPKPVEPIKSEPGFFDPLMHGLAAVGNFIKSVDQATAPQGIGDMMDRIKEIAGAVPEVPKAAGEAAAANEGKTLAERLAAEPLHKAIDVGMSFGPQSIGGAIRGMFITPAQTAAATAKGEAKEFVQGTIREQTGLARQGAAQAKAGLEEFRTDINKGLPEYTDWLKLDPAARVGQPVPMIHDLGRYIENRTKGATLDPKSPFAPVADAFRDIYTDLETTIARDYPNAMQGFYEDYTRHIWTDPTKADKLIGGGRIGTPGVAPSVFPTRAAGVDAGLIPKKVDPLDGALEDIMGMRNFIAQQEVLRLGKDHGYIQYSQNGLPPADGWTKLKGRGSELNFIYQDAAGNNQIGTQQAFGHPGFTGSYNNWIGKGFYESPIAGAIYDKLQYGANMLTGLKLGLSAYHAFNIAQETAVAGLADGIGDLAHGDLVDAIKQIAPSATILPQVGKQLYKGAKFQEQYLGIKDHGPDMKELTDLYARSGGRAMGGDVGLIGQDNPAMRSFDVWGAMFKKENANQLISRVKTDIAQATMPTGNAPVTDALVRGGKVGMLAGQWLGETMGGVMRPLFETAIPRIKNSAWADEMSSWLGRNPQATDEAKLSMARRLTDSMDDRFGELIQDNLFWPRWVKQSLNLATISVGWEYGTLRAFGGAGKDIAGGLASGLSGDLSGMAEGMLSPRARWLYSFPLTMGIMSSAYQYLKAPEGQLPTQTDTPIRDLLVPRTGGTVHYGGATYPERAQQPGYQKDAEQWGNILYNSPDYTQLPNALTGLAFNKLNPLWRTGYGLATGKDPFTGNVIRAHPDVPWWRDYADFVMKEALEPIGVSTTNERRIGTNMSTAERLSGMRPAGEALTAPEAAKGFAKLQLLKQQAAAQAYEAAHERSLEHTDAEGNLLPEMQKPPPKPREPTKSATAPSPAAPPVAPQVNPAAPPQVIPDEESAGPPNPNPAPAPAAARSHHGTNKDGTRAY